ncbi:hypothetical protein T265_12981, partial [Opisthorchis viverrini]
LNKQKEISRPEYINASSLQKHDQEGHQFHCGSIRLLSQARAKKERKSMEAQYYTEEAIYKVSETDPFPTIKNKKTPKPGSSGVAFANHEKSRKARFKRTNHSDRGCTQSINQCTKLIGGPKMRHKRAQTNMRYPLNCVLIMPPRMMTKHFFNEKRTRTYGCVAFHRRCHQQTHRNRSNLAATKSERTPEPQSLEVQKQPDEELVGEGGMHHSNGHSNGLEEAPNQSTKSTGRSRESK